MRIGVLALQGGVDAHMRAVIRLGATPIAVRYAQDLDDLDGLVFPGGESTTQLKLIALANLETPLNDFVRSGKPVLATCAGLILAAQAVTKPEQKSFGWLDVAVERNGWGRQLDSFSEVADDQHTPLVFIRAPRIRAVGDKAEVVLSYHSEPILVRQGAVYGATFHPELTDDLTVYQRAFNQIM